MRSVIEHIDSYSAKDFESAATRVITQPRWEGKVMSGADYFVEHALPNQAKYILARDVLGVELPRFQA